MSYLHKPVVISPENRVSNEEMLVQMSLQYEGHPSKDQILTMIKNLNVDTRHLIMPLDEVLQHPGVGKRTDIYFEKAMELGTKAIDKVLCNTNLKPEDIDLFIDVSCTGFLMPSISSYLINSMGFRRDVKKMPLAQLGCSGGASALLKADDYIKAYPEANVLILATEFCSLCFQPDDESVADAICASLFGDAVGACIVSGSKSGAGLKLIDNSTYLLPDSEPFISYRNDAQGFHFQLDKQTMHAVEDMAPFIKQFFENHIDTSNEIDFFYAHTGGRRIIAHLSHYVEVPLEKLKYTQDSLRHMGNLSSVSILDVIKRGYDDGIEQFSKKKNYGLLMGIGPGITIDLLAAEWC